MPFFAVNASALAAGALGGMAGIVLGRATADALEPEDSRRDNSTTSSAHFVLTTLGYVAGFVFTSALTVNLLIALDRSPSQGSQGLPTSHGSTIMQPSAPQMNGGI